MEKMASDGPKWGQEDFFLTNPDLADILGRTDLHFENFHSVFSSFGFQISGFQVPRFLKSGLGPLVGRAWALGRLQATVLSLIHI